MNGFDANFRNTSGSQLQGLAYNPGQAPAGGILPTLPVYPPILTINCGDVLDADLPNWSAPSFFRTNDPALNQLYYARTITFRGDTPGSYIISITGNFDVFFTVQRTAGTEHTFYSTTGSLVFNVDSSFTGPFVLEVTSMTPGQTGSFEVTLTCPDFQADIKATWPSSPNTGFFPDGPFTSTWNGHIVWNGPNTWTINDSVLPNVYTLGFGGVGLICLFKVSGIWNLQIKVLWTGSPQVLYIYWKGGSGVLGPYTFDHVIADPGIFPDPPVLDNGFKSVTLTTWP